jgi:hypothetical protein
MISSEEVESPDVLIHREAEIFCGLLISAGMYVFLPIMMWDLADPFGLLAVGESLLLGLQRTVESTYLPAMAGAPLLWNLLACYAIIQLARTYPWIKTVEMLLIAHFRLLVVLPVYVVKLTFIFALQLVYLVWCMVTPGELQKNRNFNNALHPFVHKPTAAVAEDE